MKKLETAPVIQDKWIGLFYNFLAVIQTAEERGQINSTESNYSKYLNAFENCNRDYLYWDKVKYKSIDDEEPIVFWTMLKAFRRLNSKYLSFGQHHFSYFVTSNLQALIHRFDLSLGWKLGGSMLSEQEKEQYLVSSIMEEAISSSQIEGAVTTRTAAEEMLRKNLAPRDKSQRMIVNNYLTIKHLKEIKDQDLTPESLCEIQEMITQNTLENSLDAGRFRISDDVNVIDVVEGEVVYSPPKVSELPELIKAICEFFNNDNSQFIHPLVKASILHFMVAYVHPFADGNGRTARTIFYWYLLKKGYWLAEYLSISRIISDSKNKYYKAFLYTETDENDLTYFVHYQLHTLQKALESFYEYVEKKKKEETKAQDFLKIPNINLRQAEILRELTEKPKWVLSIKEIQNRFSTSNQTARTDVASLVEMGYLEAFKINAKETYYRKGKTTL